VSPRQDWDCFGPGSRHRANLDRLEQTRRGGSTQMYLCRCRTCGQDYGHQHSELSDWSTLTGSDFTDVTETWTPLDPDELVAYRADPNYKPRHGAHHRHDTGWH